MIPDTDNTSDYVPLDRDNTKYKTKCSHALTVRFHTNCSEKKTLTQITFTHQCIHEYQAWKSKDYIQVYIKSLEKVIICRHARQGMI